MKREYVQRTVSAESLPRSTRFPESDACELVMLSAHRTQKIGKLLINKQKNLISRFDLCTSMSIGLGTVRNFLPLESSTYYAFHEFFYTFLRILFSTVLRFFFGKNGSPALVHCAQKKMAIKSVKIFKSVKKV